MCDMKTSEFRTKMPFASLNSAVEDKHASECGRMQVLARGAIEGRRRRNKKRCCKQASARRAQSVPSPAPPPRTTDPKMYKYLF